MNALNFSPFILRLTLTIFTVFTCSIFLPTHAQQLAFPSAYGAGAYTTGGRGFDVIHVTNLNNSGPGSFRQALLDADTEGGGIVVFDVSGVIKLTGGLGFPDNVTIAGQTAPEGGITLDGARIYLEDVNNIIVRYIRFKGGVDGNNDSLTSRGNVLNQIWDHCSFAFGADEAASFYETHNNHTVDNLTVQRCFFAESAKGSLFGGGSGTGTVTNNISFLSNLFFNTKYRFPNIAGDNARIDVVNNVVWNADNRIIRGNGSYNLNHIGNYYHFNSTPIRDVTVNLHAFGTVPQIYTSKNKIVAENTAAPLTNSVAEMNQDNKLSWKFFLNGGGFSYGEQLPDNYFTETMHTLNGRSFSTLTADDAFNDVTNNAGCNARLNSDGSVSLNLDSLDATWLTYIANGDYVSNMNPSQYNVPPQTTFTRPSNFYISNPHIPEVWFSNNVPDGQNHNDIAPSGYTWLEEYLNGVDEPAVVVSALDVEVFPNSATLNVPETLTLTTSFTPENTTNQNGVWESSNEDIATVSTSGLVTSISEGEAIITFTSDDGNFSEESVITVTNIVIPLSSVSVTPESAILEVGQELELNKQLFPENTTDVLGTWMSSDESVLIVDQEGKVTGINEGIANVTYSSTDSGVSDSAVITVVDTFFGTYELYNANTDLLIQNIEGDTTINLSEQGYEINFRSIPEGGDFNPEVESVRVDWTGPSSGTWIESGPIYAGLPGGHVGFDFMPYTVQDGTYNFTITYFTQNAASGSVIAVDNFELSFFFSNLPVANAGEDQTICFGDSITLTASGGANFLWENGETTASIEVAPEITTTYTVVVSDNEGNFDEASVTITVNEIPEADAGEGQTICLGEIAILTASGGDTYLWSTGETTAVIEVSPTEDTTYIAEVTSNNCSSTDEVMVIVNAPPTLNVTNDLVIQEGDSAVLTASDSDNYLWSTGEITPTITVEPNVTTIYSVDTTNANGCVTSETVTVTVVPEVVANAGNDATICFGDEITLSASGGLNYLWNTGDETTELLVSPTETTTYTVTVEDEYGFLDTDEVTVFVNALPVITTSENAFVMIGNGTNLTVEGAENYLWSTGETTAEIFVSPGETTVYSVISTGANGCETLNEITVTVIEVLIANAGDDIAICLGESVSLNGSGGVTYSWNTGDTSPNPMMTPTETTTYTLTVTDGFGNSDSDEVTVTVNPIPVVDISEDQVICQGESTTLTVNGGDTYLWSTGETGSSITVSPAEDTVYSVEVISNSCSDIGEVNVTVLPIPNIGLSDDVVIVTGNSTLLEVTGGDSYLWSTGDTSQNIEVSPTETTTYSVTAFLLNGCQISENVTVTVVPEVIAGVNEDVSVCLGETVTLTASGSENFVWNTGETTASITVTPSETTEYSVTVSDNFGNSDTDSVMVTVNNLPTLTVSENLMIFEGETTDLVVNGASSYLWSTGESTNEISVSPVVTTIYSVSGFSAAGCETVEEITVTVIPEVIADAGNDQSICLGETVTLTASGSENFVWNTGETTASITVTPSETTEYTVTVSDNFGNSDTDSVMVTVNNLPILTVSEDLIIYEGETIELVVNGADTYLWSTGESTNTISVSPIETTIYTVTGFSQYDCEAFEDINVTVIPQVIADAGEDVTICLGEIVTLNASGGETYAWDNGGTSATRTFAPNETTTYTVTAFDAYGNSDSDSVTVTVNPLPIINVSENVTIIEGESTSLSVDGADSYIWSNGLTTNTISVSPTTTTTYSVTGISNGCYSETSQIIVTVEPLFVASAGVDERVCDNQITEIVLTANEGDSYLWSTGETTRSITVSPTSTVSYSVTVTSNGQEDDDDVTVYVDPSPEVVVLNGDSIDILSGDFVTLSASGANTYEWNNGATQPNIAVSPNVTTIYEVKGYIGDCYDEKEIVVNVFEPVVADAGEDVSICLDDVTTLTATGGDEYVWSTGETTQSIQVSPSETTEYTVTVFNPLDFDEATVTVEIENNCEGQTIVNPVGVPLDFDFNVFPNPASDMVNVKYSGVLEVSNVNIYDVTGKLVQRIKISNENLSLSNTKQIDISYLQSGVYFVKLIGEEKDIIHKLIVK